MLCFNVVGNVEGWEFDLQFQFPKTMNLKIILKAYLNSSQYP